MSSPPEYPAILASRPYPVAEFRLLQLAARLLLEYNFRSELVKTKLARVAQRLGVDVLVFVAYRGVTLFSPEGHQHHAQARELRINVAVSARVNQILLRLADGQLSIADATAALERVEQDAPQHPRWLLAALYGVAAAALARLLKADGAAAAVSGVSAALGLLVRRELLKRHVLYAAPPFTAALLGAVLGGLVIRLGWTTTPGFCLLVPALMLVPGPHLINGLYDMLENHMQTGLSRLSLATVVLVASAVGVFLGGWLTLGTPAVEASPSQAVVITFALDVALAGLASCGFSASYNAPWRYLWISVACGMVGHGLRFVCLQQGMGLEVSTLLACLTIGALAGRAVDRLEVPFAAVAFAGAVPMMPGAIIYQAFGGALHLARAGAQADPVLAAATAAAAVRSGLVVGAMALGLLLGARLAGLARQRH